MKIITNNPFTNYVRQRLRRILIPNDQYARFPTRLGSLIMPTDWRRSSLILNLYIRNRVYEPETVAYLQQHVSPGDIALDVGANFGYYTVLFSQLVRHGWVHAWEPNPDCYKVLKQNARSRSNVLTYQTAASDEAGQAWFYRHRFYGMGGLMAIEGMDGRFLVATVPLDHYDFPHVDWIKIDVEGHEGEVLAGLKDTIAKNPGIHLIIEFKPERGLADCFWDVLDGFEFRSLDHNVLAFREEAER